MLGLFVLVFSCKKQSSVVSIPGLDVSKMDTTANPTQDFYQFVNGGWEANNSIPDDEARWGSFNELRDVNNERTLALVDKALENDKIDLKSDEGKVVSFFKTAMDTAARNNAGTEPIKDMLASIDGISSMDDLLEFMISTEAFGSTLFGVGVFSDRKDSNTNALYLRGGSLGLPERDYYVGQDDDGKEKREKYAAHIARMFSILGGQEGEPLTKAEGILSFETMLAEAMMTKEESRDPKNSYNPMTLEELKTMAPAIDWAKYFSGVGAKGFKEIIVTQPKYIKAVNALFASGQLDRVKSYLEWSVLNDAASYLTEEMETANFDFYGAVLEGTESQKPQNERVLRVTNGVLGQALGQLYVKEYFPAEAKQVASDMVSNIRKAFGNRIDNLEWMSDETKAMAHKKLDGFRVKIGYPDDWKDYGNLEVGDSYYQNILNARKWNFEEDIVKIGKPVDKGEWFMNPQTVNAYYNAAYNEIVFPAAILQPPFFNFEADAAINYGGIGAVIGHEISHGFDDSGAKFDADGNLIDWWTEEDFAKFNERGQQLIDQYSKYEPLPGVFVNGEYTLGENIGDLGGINVAYDGLQLHMAENGDPGDIDGFSQNQRLFISWATIWRTLMRDAEMQRRIKTDSHSPGSYRAVGPIVNVDGFHEAFNTQPGDDMYKAPEDRIRIW